MLTLRAVLHSHVRSSLVKAHPGSAQRASGSAVPDSAIDSLNRADLALFAVAAGRRRGELIAGDEGDTLVIEADAWLRGQPVADPARFIRIFAPGFATSH